MGVIKIWGEINLNCQDGPTVHPFPDKGVTAEKECITMKAERRGRAHPRTLMVSGSWKTQGNGFSLRAFKRNYFF